MQAKVLLVVLFFSMSLQRARADVSDSVFVEVPKSMAAMGDSITAAAIASMNREDGVNNLLLPRFFWMLVRFGYNKSISAFEDRKLSWATGWDKNIFSHAKKINEMLRRAGGSQLQYVNAAVSGDTSNGLALQAQKILEWSDQNLSGKTPDYVVLEIGSNDLCANTLESMTSPERYLQNVDAALNIFLERNSQSRVLIGSIPNLEHLREVAQNSPITGLPFINRCQDMWNTHHFCRTMLEEDSPEKRAIVMDRLKSYMDGLEKLSVTLNEKWGEDRVRFSSDVYNYNFNDEEISVDCFHPNLEGQQVISDQMWKNTWWLNE